MTSAFLVIFAVVLAFGAATGFDLIRLMGKRRNAGYIPFAALALVYAIPCAIASPLLLLAAFFTGPLTALTTLLAASFAFTYFRLRYALDDDEPYARAARFIALASGAATVALVIINVTAGTTL